VAAGTAAVIISPTRELALQIFQVVSELMKYHHQTFGIVMGGANRCEAASHRTRAANAAWTDAVRGVGAQRRKSLPRASTSWSQRPAACWTICRYIVLVVLAAAAAPCACAAT
jgi:hypothetical protein